MNRFLTALVAVACLAVTMPPAAQADVTCFRCGTVMHTNQPQAQCWHCGRPLSGPGPAFPPPADPFGPMSSGFELGVTVIPTPRGVRVTAVQPGSAASGVLFVNDIIVAAAYRDDFGQKQVLPTRSGDDLEQVKHMAGQSKTALMIRRPSGQTRYAFVSFRPVGPMAYRGAVPVEAARVEGGAGSMTIDNTGEAAALFGGGGGDATPVPGDDGSGGNPGVGSGGENAADFFNDR